MSPTRRRFLAGLSLAAVAAGAAWIGRDPLLRGLLATPLGDDRPGPLRPSTAAVLEVTVRTLLEDRVDPGHYLDAFRWRARRRAGARALYERFERAMDAAARRAGYAGFGAAPPEARTRILAPLRPRRGWQRAVRLVFARDEARYARHVVRETFHHFVRTDAWTLAGYDTWPGKPRGIGPFGTAGDPS